MSRLAITLDPKHHADEKWGFCGTWYWYEHLIKTFDPIIIDSQDTYDKHKHEITAVYAAEFGCPMIEYDNDVKQYKALFISDPHEYLKQTWVVSYIKRNIIGYVFTPYYLPMLRHFPSLAQFAVIVRFPWAIPDEFIADAGALQFYHSTKKIFNTSIHIFGSMGGHPAYDVREWCTQFPFVETENHDRNHRRYDKKTYWSILQTYHAAIAAGSSRPEYGLVLPKYYEIAASGSLLFAQEYGTGDLRACGFNETNCVPFNNSNFELLAKDYLEHPECYYRRRVQAVKMIRDRHSITARSTQLAMLLDL